MKIMQTALAGINTARLRFEKSATDLLNAAAPVRTVEQEQPTNEIQPVASIPEIGAQSTSYAASDIDFIKASVDMMTSSLAYKTNIQVLKAWNDTPETVLSELTA